MFTYSKYIMEMGISMLELISEALGLAPNYLKDMACAEGLFQIGPYYPSCPEPELTALCDQNVHQSVSELKVGEFVKSQGKKRYATLPSVIYALFFYGFEISSLIPAANLNRFEGNRLCILTLSVSFSQAVSLLTASWYLLRF